MVKNTASKTSRKAEIRAISRKNLSSQKGQKYQVTRNRRDFE